MFTPIWGKDPIWLTFSKWVETKKLVEDLACSCLDKTGFQEPGYVCTSGWHDPRCWRFTYARVFPTCPPGNVESFHPTGRYDVKIPQVIRIDPLDEVGKVRCRCHVNGGMVFTKKIRTQFDHGTYDTYTRTTATKNIKNALNFSHFRNRKRQLLGLSILPSFTPSGGRKVHPHLEEGAGCEKNLPNKNPKPLRKSSKFGPSKIGIHRDIQGPLKVRNSWIAAMKHAANLWWNFEGIFFPLKILTRSSAWCHDPFLSVPLRYSIKCGISKLIRSEKPLFSQKDCIFIWHATTTNRGPLHMF